MRVCEPSRLIGRKSDYRFFEFEYPWTSDTEFAHKIELKGSMSIPVLPVNQRNSSCLLPSGNILCCKRLSAIHVHSTCNSNP